MTKLDLMTAAAMALLAAPAPSIAMAQEPAGGAELDEVIVTAQRRAERLQDVPLAISAISGGDLQDRNISNLEQLTSTLPNVNITQNRGAGVVTVRGIGFAIATAGADPGVAVHQDGVYISRPPAALTSFYDVERLEVARGPQGTLYGRNATGGAVNIISRAPTPEFDGYLSLSYGNYDAVITEGAVSGPIVPDKLMARLSFQTQNHDGYGRNLFTGGVVDDLDTEGARARVRFMPTERLTIDLSADYYHENDRNFTGHFWHYYVPCTPPPPGIPPAGRCATSYGGMVQPESDLRNTLLNTDTYNRREFYGGSIHASLDLGEMTLSSLTSYRRYDYLWIIDGDGSTAAWADAGRREDAITLSQEFQATGKLGKLDYVAGYFFFAEDNAGSGFGTITAPFISVGLNLQNGTQVTKASAVFGQATYNFTDRLALTLGGRYSNEKKTLSRETIGPASVAVARPVRQASFNRFTPMASVSFKFTPDILAYATYQEGFKSGGFAIGAGTPPFEPEYITNYEAGIKSTWFDGALRANVSAFRYDYTNLQIGFTQNLVTVVTNAASAKVSGVEGEFVVRPTPGLLLEANLAYLDATFKEYFTFDPARSQLGLLDLSGNHVPYAPKFSGLLAAQYEWPAFGGALTARIEHIFAGKTYFDAFNLPVNIGPSYNFTNLYLAYETADGDWRAEAFMRNVEDKLIINGSTVGGGVLGAPSFVNLLPPRLYGMKLTRNF